jgi:hypothetical protein
MGKVYKPIVSEIQIMFKLANIVGGTADSGSLRESPCFR